MTCAHGVSPISLPSIDAARNLGPIGSVYTFPHFSRDIVLGLSSKNNCTSYDWSKWKPLFKIASVSPHDQCCDSQESLETWWKCNSVQNMPPPIPFCCEEFTALSQLCLTIPTQRQQFVKEIKRIVCKEMQDFEEEESLSKLFTLAVMFLRLLSLRRHSFCGQFYAADAGLSVVLELVVLHDYIKTSQAQWGYLMDGHLFQKLSMTVRRCFLSSSQPNSFAQACDALCCTLSLHIIMRRVGTDFPVLAKKGWMTDKIRNLMQKMDRVCIKSASYLKTQHDGQPLVVVGTCVSELLCALDPDTYPLRTHLGCHNQEFGRVGRVSVHENCLVQTHLMPEHNGRRILPGVQTRVTITDQFSVHIEMIQTNPDFVAPRPAQSAREWIHLLTQSFSTCGTRSSTSLCANDVLLRKDDLVVLTTSEAMVWSHDEFAHMLYVGLSVLHDIRDAFDRAPISLRGRITEFSLAVRAALLPDFLSLFDPENGKRHAVFFLHDSIVFGCFQQAARNGHRALDFVCALKDLPAINAIIESNVQRIMHLAFASLLKDASTESKFLSTTSIMNKDLWAIRNVLDHQFGDDFFDDWAQDAITDFAKHPITVPAYLLHAFLQTTLMLGGDPSSPSDSSFLGFEFKVPAGVDWPTIFVTENEQRGFISFVVIASPANLGSVDIVKIQYSPKDRDKAQHLQAISRDISEIFKDTIYASWSAKGIDMLQESGSEKPASSDTDDSLCSICSGRLTDAGSSLLSPPPAPCGASCPPGPDDTVQRSIQHGDQLLQSIREEEEERSAAEVRRRDRNKVKRQNDRSRRRLQQEKAREEAASAREAEERHTMLVLKEQVREEKRLNKKRAVQAHLQRLRQAGVYTEAAGTPCGALSDTAAGSCSADSATCEGLSRTGAGSCSADSATREGLSRTDAIEQRAALSECVICLTAGVSFCVLPCLHVVYCEGCAQHLQYEILLSCPMCFSTDGVGGYDMRFDGKHVHCAPWRDGEAFFGREAFVRESL